MSEVIDQFKAERDSELQSIDEQYSQLQDNLLREAKEAKEIWDKAFQKIQEQKRVPTDEEDGIKNTWEKASNRYNASIFEWRFAQEAVRKKMKKGVVSFYREHPGEIDDVVILIKEEVPNLLLTASMKVDHELTPEEAQRREEVKGIIKNYSDDLDDEEDRQFIYDVTFSDDSLRRYLRSSLRVYLDLVKEISSDKFQEVDSYIEGCIADKDRLVSKQRKRLGTSKKKPEKTKSTVLSITTQKAKDAVFGVSKVEGATFDPGRNDFLYNDLLPVNIDVGVLKKKTISALVSIDFSKMKKLGVSIGSDQRVTPYDREVHNAISTLCAAGNEYITPQMIYQVLSGNKKDVRMDVKAREEILESIEKMMVTLINIDATAELEAGWNTEGRYRGPLVPAERVELIKLNGQEVIDCIHLFRNPPLYDYANNKNQIDRVDIKMLNAPMNNTTENIELKGYLLRQISSMQNPHSKLKPIIRYDTLYDYLGIEAPSDGALKKKRKEIRDKVKRFLDFWVNEGFIKGYEEEKEGKTIAKVKIEL